MAFIPTKIELEQDLSKMLPPKKLRNNLVGNIQQAVDVSRKSISQNPNFLLFSSIFHPPFFTNLSHSCSLTSAKCQKHVLMCFCFSFKYEIDK